MVMPIGRYLAWVGTSLLALLFLADWVLPKSLPESTSEAIIKPVIRITSVQQLPERIIIDTSQPTTVVRPPLVQDADAIKPVPLQSYASAASSSTIADVDQEKPTVSKRRLHKLATKGPRSASHPAVASGRPATTVQPTRLSFIDFISRQLGRNRN
jgi:hypothetical protein